MGADYLALIKGARAFEGLSDADLAALIAVGQPVTIGPGEAIIRSGGQADAFFVVGSGAVEVIASWTPESPLDRPSDRTAHADDKRERLATLGPGQLFGEMAMIFQDAPRIADVVAIEPTEVLSIGYTTFRRFEGERPSLYRTVTDNLSQLADARSWTNPVDLIFNHYISAFSDK